MLPRNLNQIPYKDALSILVRCLEVPRPRLVNVQAASQNLTKLLIYGIYKKPGYRLTEGDKDKATFCRWWVDEHRKAGEPLQLLQEKD